MNYSLLYYQVNRDYEFDEFVTILLGLVIVISALHHLKLELLLYHSSSIFN